MKYIKNKVTMWMIKLRKGWDQWTKRNHESLGLHSLKLVTRNLPLFSSPKQKSNHSFPPLNLALDTPQIGSLFLFSFPSLCSKQTPPFRRQINLPVWSKIWPVPPLKSPTEKKVLSFALRRDLYSHRRHRGEANIWTSSMVACRVAVWELVWGLGCSWSVGSWWALEAGRSGRAGGTQHAWQGENKLGRELA